MSVIKRVTAFFYFRKTDIFNCEIPYKETNNCSPEYGKNVL